MQQAILVHLFYQIKFKITVKLYTFGKQATSNDKKSLTSLMNSLLVFFKKLCVITMLSQKTQNLYKKNYSNLNENIAK